MGSEEKQTTNIDEVAAKIAQDIAAMHKKTAEMKLPSDLREIDLATLVPPGTTGLLKSAFTRLSAESKKVQQEHQAQVEEQARALEESIDARQQAMKQKMSDLEKAEAEAGDSARVVRERMNNEVKRYEQRMVELRLDKTVGFARAKVEPAGAVKVESIPVTPAKKVSRKSKSAKPAQ